MQELPTEITQSNARVAEIRLICDQCGQLIGTHILPMARVEKEKGAKIICQRCKEANIARKK
jgi:hypothetical protein